MLRTIFAGVAVVALCCPVAAQHWIPPRPGPNGIDTCSGWDTAEARQKCSNEEAERQRRIDDRRRSEQAQVKAIQDAAQARVAADRAAEAERARVAAAQAKSRQDAWDAQQAKQRADYAAQQENFARAEAADEYKRKDAQDAFVAPEALDGEKIKLGGMFCYAPRDNDVRCWTPEAEVVVFATAIEPPEAQTALREQCGSVRASSTTMCLRVLRFVMSGYRRDNEGDGTERVVITPSLLIVTRVP